MKILVIQQKMIGDVLTSSVLFEALRKKFPEAELHYLIYKHTLPVVENNPFIDQFLLLDPEKDSAPKAMLALGKDLRNKKYDAVIDVYSKIGTALLTAMSGAGIRISYDKWYTRKFYSETFRPKKTAETGAGLAIENRMQLLKGIGPDFPVEVKPRIFLSSEEKEAAKNLLVSSGVNLAKPLFMCGILGSSAAKTYPADFMAEVLDYVVKKSGAQLLFNYIPKQKPEALEILELCRPATQKHVFFNVFGRSLREFIGITAHCDALIGNEGGAVNMAKAVEIPTFSIFSPQIKKENWSIYEDGKMNVSVHIADFMPRVHKIPKKEKRKKSAAFYELLKPDLIFAKLEGFLKEIAIPKKNQTK